MAPIHLPPLPAPRTTSEHVHLSLYSAGISNSLYCMLRIPSLFPIGLNLKFVSIDVIVHPMLILWILKSALILLSPYILQTIAQKKGLSKLKDERCPLPNRVSSPYCHIHSLSSGYHSHGVVVVCSDCCRPKADRLCLNPSNTIDQLFGLK